MQDVLTVILLMEQQAMSIYNATSFEATPSAEPKVRKMSGLPRLAVWTVMIGAPWVVIVQAVRLIF